jgi:nucleoid-associated protein EbfC
MFGKLGDMVGKFQEMKQKADEAKKRLDEILLTAEGAGGDIKVQISGNRKINSISIAPALQHGNKEELEKELIATLNRAIELADKTNEEEMKRAAEGLLGGKI